jgi:hypothetical protein
LRDVDGDRDGIGESHIGARDARRTQPLRHAAFQGRKYL